MYTIHYFFLLQTRHPRFLGENLEKNKEFYARLEKLSQKHNCTPAQLALAWVLHRGEDVVPIPGKSDIRMMDSARTTVRLFVGGISKQNRIYLIIEFVCQEQLRSKTWTVT